MDKELLVKCPMQEGVYYFLWLCRDRQREGWVQCVQCDAPNRPVEMGEIVFDDNEKIVSQ